MKKIKKKSENDREKIISKEKHCPNHGLWSRTIGYCKTRNIVCLCNKHGYENIKIYTITLPYDKTEDIYSCDGKLPKSESTV